MPLLYAIDTAGSPDCEGSNESNQNYECVRFVVTLPRTAVGERRRRYHDHAPHRRAVPAAGFGGHAEVQRSVFHDD